MTSYLPRVATGLIEARCSEPLSECSPNSAAVDLVPSASRLPPFGMGGQRALRSWAANAHQPAALGDDPPFRHFPTRGPFREGRDVLEEHRPSERPSERPDQGIGGWGLSKLCGAPTPMQRTLPSGEAAQRDTSDQP